MRKFGSLVVVSAVVMWVGLVPSARAQSLDAAFGLNALTASQAVQNIPKLGGGLFPSASAQVHLGAIGIGAEVAFRATQNSSQLRPIYYDVNAILTPFTLGRSIYPELLVGVGAQSIQDYAGLANCGSLGGCADYGSTHLSGHVGLELKIYVTQHIFLRPEAHFYFIRNNQQLQAANAERFGISLGYTFGGA